MGAPCFCCGPVRPACRRPVWSKGRCTAPRRRRPAAPDKDTGQTGRTTGRREPGPPAGRTWQWRSERPHDLAHQLGRRLHLHQCVDLDHKKGGCAHGGKAHQGDGGIGDQGRQRRSQRDSPMTATAADAGQEQQMGFLDPQFIPAGPLPAPRPHRPPRARDPLGQGRTGYRTCPVPG